MRTRLVRALLAVAVVLAMLLSAAAAVPATGGGVARALLAKKSGGGSEPSPSPPPPAKKGKDMGPMELEKLTIKLRKSIVADLSHLAMERAATRCDYEGVRARASRPLYLEPVFREDELLHGIVRDLLIEFRTDINNQAKVLCGKTVPGAEAAQA